MNDTYLAIDFGAGSGRVIAGQVRDGRLEMQELHRFPNRQIKLGVHVYWDFLSLFEEMKTGIRKATGAGLRVRSIGIDTWGVDFGLIDRAGSLLGNPQCYRDPCTEGMPETFFQDVSPLEHYRESGEAVLENDTGLLVTRHRIGNVTFWVKFTEDTEGYTVRRAYSHRMTIETR